MRETGAVSRVSRAVGAETPETPTARRPRPETLSARRSRHDMPQDPPSERKG